MKSRINIILSEIDKKTEELKREYHKMMDKYGFSFKKGKIEFSIGFKKLNKAYKRSLWKSFSIIKFREIISIPFIYFVFFPVVLLDITIICYQQIVFRLYKIPFVKRKDYIIYDRKLLDYLNIIQKFNCIYCSYVNGFCAYATEIVGRTERYWCPIKHAKKTLSPHNWEKHFADYGDALGFKETFCKDENTYRK